MTAEEDEPPDDPNDPSHPDHDLSEAAGYSAWQAPAKPWFTRRWVLLTVAALVIVGLVLPFVRPF